MPRSSTILVAGATGQQGGAVARLLLEKGHRVRALTRRPDSERAGDLRALGAEVVGGDLEDATAMARAAADADAFFLVATPFEHGVEAEVRQALRGAGAAKAAGVKHLVYSSVAGAMADTGIPHFESKREVEAHLRTLGLPHTVIAPAFFMENVTTPASLASLREGRLALPLSPGRRLQVVALADLAALARMALERPSEFEGRRIELASDELTAPEMARALSQATRQRIEYARVPLEAILARNEDLGRMFAWFEEVGYHVDLDGLRRDFPEVSWRSFGEWARSRDWSVLQEEHASERPSA